MVCLCVGQLPCVVAGQRGDRGTRVLRGKQQTQPNLVLAPSGSHSRGGVQGAGAPGGEEGQAGLAHGCERGGCSVAAGSTQGCSVCVSTPAVVPSQPPLISPRGHQSPRCSRPTEPRPCRGRQDRDGLRHFHTFPRRKCWVPRGSLSCWQWAGPRPCRQRVPASDKGREGESWVPRPGWCLLHLLGTSAPLGEHQQPRCCLGPALMGRCPEETAAQPVGCPTAVSAPPRQPASDLPRATWHVFKPLAAV